MEYQLQQVEERSKQVEKQYQLSIRNPAWVNQLFKGSTDFLTKIYTQMYWDNRNKKKIHFPQEEVEFHLHRFHVMAKYGARKNEQLIPLLENIYYLVLWETINFHFPMHAELTIKSFLLQTAKMQSDLWITDEMKRRKYPELMAALYGPPKIKMLDEQKLYESLANIVRNRDNTQIQKTHDVSPRLWPIQRTPYQQLYHQLIHWIKPQLFYQPSTILKNLEAMFFLPYFVLRSEQLWYLRTFKQMVKQGIEFYSLRNPINQIYLKTMKKYRVTWLEQWLPLRPRTLIYEYLHPRIQLSSLFNYDHFTPNNMQLEFEHVFRPSLDYIHRKRPFSAQSREAHKYFANRMYGQL